MRTSMLDCSPDAEGDNGDVYKYLFLFNILFYFY